MTDKIREEFEAWALARFINSETMKPLQRSANEPDGYHYPVLNTAWSAWQASREALVIELPYDSDGLNPDHSFVKGWRSGVEETKSAIEAAGLKVTP